MADTICDYPCNFKIAFIRFAHLDLFARAIWPFNFQSMKLTSLKCAYLPGVKYDGSSYVTVPYTPSNSLNITLSISSYRTAIDVRH